VSAASFPATEGRAVIVALIATVDEHAAMLSEIDGAIGDGDHGVNMRKGFLLVQEALPETVGLAEGLELIGDTLVTRIGGAMGPLYGSFFSEMADACAGVEAIDAPIVARMLAAGREEVQDLGEASVGDKTLLDALVPAQTAFDDAVAAGAPFADALASMAAAAERGKESTRDLVARVGRASRLGERSRGVLDAGATSCWLLLTAMAESMRQLLGAED
jgi:dihydroxyacetone kinase-like protein